MRMLITDLEACEEFTAGDGTLLREILHPHRTDLEIRYSLAHAVVKPGNESQPHKLTTSEVYYILEGAGEMHINGESSPVTPGQTVYIPPNAVQHIRNTGNADLKFLCIVDPAWQAEDEEIL